MSAGAAAAGGGRSGDRSKAPGKSGGLPRTAGGHSPWAVAMVVALAAFMEVLDTTIANVALRYIAGGLAVGPDESSWVVTTYLVANAITLIASSFLAKRYGRKLFFMWSVGLFTLSSLACGFAWSLESLLFFRILQGLGGGGMAPLAQSILADSFPPEKRGQAFAVYGIAIVFAPAIGPTLGGWLSDNLSWHWCFLINGPIGVLSLGLMYWLLEDPDSAVKERRRLNKLGVRFDVVGFLLVATFLGSLEVCLDEGQRKDWFGTSTLMNVAGVMMVVSFVAMIPWNLTRKNPAVDFSLFKQRQFATCFGIMLATGAILIATTQFIPQIVQDNYGYTATLAGLVLAPGGFVTVLVTAFNGRVLSPRVQPKWLILVGSAMMAAGLYNLTWLYGDSTFWFFGLSRIYIGIGIPLTFLSVTSASYEGLKKDQTDQASALINVARNVGGSLGVSLAQNVLAYRGQFHQSRLAESITPTSPGYQETMRQAMQYFTLHGTPGVDAQGQATAWIGQQLASQTTYFAYIDVFWALCLVSASAVPLALILKPVERGAPAG
ncbi:DHA2 family efflux MFS transporter permease subunit [uncultured Methylobacterium sp.]|uniref:DHA2 family efflux MFS transporter permease subunit n=1 Tax=uncultured Methylobacterium sp. TaxID=157278 RepID=UPI0035CA4060